MIRRLARNLKLGLTSLWSHRLRSALTMLGIVFGVASVVCMLAIGEGLSHEAREQIRRLGSNNIIIRSVKPPEDSSANESSRSVPNYGVTYADVERVRVILPHARVFIPARRLRGTVYFRGRTVEAAFVGTVPWWLETSSRTVQSGTFFGDADMHHRTAVCLLTRSVHDRLRGLASPLGDFVRLDSDYFRVVGLIDDGTAGESDADSSPLEIVMPLTTLDSRFGEMTVERKAGSFSYERVELHQVTVSLKNDDDVPAAADLIQAALRPHHSKEDFELLVPLHLLAEKERVKRLYNMVLGLMAAISLLVGGIGIMNIMLATVNERTPEIGIRRAIGARQRDILLQFLVETLLLSGIGGVIGAGLGIALPGAISAITGVTTIVTWWSVALAVGISGVIGVLFGFYPAGRAAALDPIVALRHE